MYIGESFRAGRSVGQATIRTVHNTKIRVAALNSQFGAIQPTDFIVHFGYLSYKRIGRYGNGFWLLIWLLREISLLRHCTPGDHGFGPLSNAWLLRRLNPAPIFLGNHTYTNDR